MVIAHRRPSVRRGFTLVELVVVVVVITLLIGLAAFGYSRFVSGSKDSAAVASLRQVSAEIAGIAASAGGGQVSYTAASLTEAAESAIGQDAKITSVTSGPSMNPRTLSVAAPVTDSETAGLALRSETGKCAVLVLVGVKPQTDLWDDVSASCSATAALDAYAAGNLGSSPEPTDPGALPAPTNVTPTTMAGSRTITVAFDAVDGADTYRVYLDGATEPVWTGASSPAAFDADPGDHTVRVRAVRADVLGALSAAAPVRVPADTNDQFADAWVLDVPTTNGTTSSTGGTTSLPGTTVDMTHEAQEPTSTSGATMTGSVWYKFTPPQNMTLIVKLSAPESGTQIWNPYSAVYAGNSLSALTPVTDDHWDGSGWARTLYVPAQAGTDYYVRVANDQAHKHGAFTVNLTRGLAHDNYADAAELEAPSDVGPVTENMGTTINASTEPGEPNTTYGAIPTQSVWYTFVAPESGVYRIGVWPASSGTTISHPFIGAFVGNDLATAERVGVEHYGTVPRSFDFPTTAGQRYHIRVSCDLNKVGGFTLRLSRNS